jgi:adenylate cyclase
MAEDSIIEQLLAYLPPDRARAVLGGSQLPAVAPGSVLFSDISGFTPLTEAVIARYGPRRGGEEFTDRLNSVYDALITEVDRFGGSIVGFAGDAMFAWFTGDDGTRAVTTALAMQRAMEKFANVVLRDGETVSLSMKVAVSSGTLQRFAAGDSHIQLFDVIAGNVMERVAACEGVASGGEIAVDGDTARRLGKRLKVREWRKLPAGSEPDDVAFVDGLHDPVEPRFQDKIVLPEDAAERLRPWLVPEVARWILSGQNVFLTELRPAVALFTRFSGIDFENDPAAPGKLDHYVRWLQKIITPLGGVLVQLTIGEKGSYFYAAWGAPIAHDDDSMRACTAALEIIRPPPEIAAFIHNTQIGITRGTMRTGAYGNRLRRTYGVLGDDTNLSARLMAKAGANEILVSERAAHRQFETFELESLPPVTVKGKKEPIPVFRLKGRRRTGILGEARGARHASPMIGRRRERALAVERLRLARKKRGQVIAIAAEAGMGKTRLLTEVIREAVDMGFSPFAGDCQVFARDASYSVWVPIWRAFFNLPVEADAAATLANLENQLAAVDAALRARAPLLGPLVNVALPDNELTRTLDPKVRRSSLEGLVIECIRHRARSGPLLFVLEECHWIDEASRHLLSVVVKALSRLPVAVVLAHRPVEVGEVLAAEEAALENVTTITLGDLPPDEARQLVELKLRVVFGADKTPPEKLIDLIAARAGGNPFFIEEVANLLKSQREKLDDPGALESLELPDSLHSLVLGRIDQMGEDAQVTLKVASVIGRLFRAAMLFGVHPIEQGRLNIPAHVTEMRARDVVLPEPAEGEEAYLFKHVVIQEVAYESLPYAMRSRIHEEIGNFLEKVAGENPRPWLDLLAFHFERSQRDDKKRHYFLAAGDAARAAYALKLAISYYERAIALLGGAERIDILHRLGEVLELAGRWTDAFARYREARALADEVGTAAQRAAVGGAIGDLHRKRGEFPDAEMWLKRARQENADLGNEHGVAMMLHLEATLCAQMGNFAGATDLCHRALAIRERLGDEANAAKTLNNLGIVARAQGDVDKALGFYERSLEIRRRGNDRREIANSLNNLGFAHRFRKEFERAREMLEESVQLNRAVGDRWSTANALTSLAELALDTGDAELAGRCLKESVAINRELGDRRALAFLLEGFGHLGRLKNDFHAALQFFAAARALRESIGAPLEPADAAKHEAAIAQIRKQIDASLCNRAEQEGRTMPLGEILDRAESAFS